ncbi:MAG: hypothetical protein DCC48_15745 [Acidobacteria bacterium]|nr:MAG: hypothetical protein DCC48_15745 [Acidobacteriota bacterium]
MLEPGPAMALARSRLAGEAQRVLSAVEEVRALNRPEVWRGRIPRASREELELLLRRIRAWVEEITAMRQV